MKRTGISIIILALPAVLYAMKPISDAELSDVLAKSGISIFIDMTMNIQIGTLAWGDPDGAKVQEAGTEVQMPGGWVGIDSLNISNLHIWPRTDFLMNTDPSSGTRKDLQPLTINIVTIPASGLDH